MTDKPTQPNAASGEPHFLEAAKQRKKIPLWAIPIFPVLLLWAIIYVNGVTNPPAGKQTAESMGGAVYSKNCASCHGATGGGGTGPAFAGGDLDKVFPKWEEQVEWVNVGSAKWTETTGSKTFGDTKKPLAGVMPGFGPIGGGGVSCTDILLVIRYERETLAKIAPEDKLVEMTDQIVAGQTPADIPNCK